ncbi:MAG: hypothetical protein KA436_12010 [Oligoflexales bacterium]|nr:hypothetical protein [Oligoflexales bacterium]
MLSGRVERKRSTIPGGGDGLFIAVNGIKKGDPVVVYGGGVLDKESHKLELFLQTASASYSVGTAGKRVVDGSRIRLDSSELAHLAGALANDRCFNPVVQALLQEAYDELAKMPFDVDVAKLLNMESGPSLPRDALPEIGHIFAKVLAADKAYRACSQSTDGPRQDLLNPVPAAKGYFIVLHAADDLPKGTEVFLAYGMSYWIAKLTIRLHLRGQVLAALLFSTMNVLREQLTEEGLSSDQLGELVDKELPRGIVYFSPKHYFFVAAFSSLLGINSKTLESWRFSEVLVNEFADLIQAMLPLIRHRPAKEFESTAPSRSLRPHPRAIAYIRHILELARIHQKKGATFEAADRQTGQKLYPADFLRLLKAWENRSAKPISQFAAEHPDWHNPAPTGACFLLALSHALSTPLNIQSVYHQAFQYIMEHSAQFVEFVPGLDLQAYVQSMVTQLQAHLASANLDPAMQIQAPWADHVLIVAFSHVLGINFSVQNYDQWGNIDGPPVAIITTPGAQTFHLACFDNRHFFAPPQPASPSTSVGPFSTPTAVGVNASGSREGRNGTDFPDDLDTGAAFLATISL